MRLVISRLSPPACALATEGSRTTARELTMAEGNMIKDMAMPFRTPSVLTAWDWLKPKAASRLGIRMDSALLKRFMTSRFAMSGRASAMRGMAMDAMEGAWGSGQVSPSFSSKERSGA